MTRTDETPDAEGTNAGAQLRQASMGLVHYVEGNPLAAIAGALIVGVILVRFAFLGNPKAE